MVVACAVLSGCAGGNVDDGERNFPSTSQVITETQANPWDLPIEDRPELFDPCAEIPVEAVQEVVGGPVEPAENLHNHRPGDLLTCGWKNKEVLFGIIGTWLSIEDFMSDTTFDNTDPNSVVAGRSGFRATDKGDQFETTCYQGFFTGRGAVVVNVNLIDSLGEFQGAMFSTACEVLEQRIDPIMQYIPEGNF